MPCQAGFGMGIDRIVALLKGQKNLRDAVLFPLVRPEQVKKSAKQLEKEYRAKKIIMIADESKPYGVTANAMGQLGIAI